MKYATFKNILELFKYVNIGNAGILFKWFVVIVVVKMISCGITVHLYSFKRIHAHIKQLIKSNKVYLKKLTTESKLKLRIEGHHFF